MKSNDIDIDLFVPVTDLCRIFRFHSLYSYIIVMMYQRLTIMTIN